VQRLSFDLSNTDVRVGVALGNAGEIGVVAFQDSLFVTYEGCSISKVPKVITVIWEVITMLSAVHLLH
jgi:hypothetical protein